MRLNGSLLPWRLKESPFQREMSIAMLKADGSSRADREYLTRPPRPLAPPGTGYGGMGGEERTPGLENRRRGGVLSGLARGRDGVLGIAP